MPSPPTLGTQRRATQLLADAQNLKALLDSQGCDKDSRPEVLGVMSAELFRPKKPAGVWNDPHHVEEWRKYRLALKQYEQSMHRDEKQRKLIEKRGKWRPAFQHFLNELEEFCGETDQLDWLGTLSIVQAYRSEGKVGASRDLTFSQFGEFVDKAVARLQDYLGVTPEESASVVPAPGTRPSSLNPRKKTRGKSRVRLRDPYKSDSEKPYAKAEIIAFLESQGKKDAQEIYKDELGNILKPIVREEGDVSWHKFSPEDVLKLAIKYVGKRLKVKI